MILAPHLAAKPPSGDLSYCDGQEIYNHSYDFRATPANRIFSLRLSLPVNVFHIIHVLLYRVMRSIRVGGSTETKQPFRAFFVFLPSTSGQ